MSDLPRGIIATLEGWRDARRAFASSTLGPLTPFATLDAARRRMFVAAALLVDSCRGIYFGDEDEALGEMLRELGPVHVTRWKDEGGESGSISWAGREDTDLLHEAALRIERVLQCDDFRRGAQCADLGRA